ncbi:hypothetical protein Tco_1566253 [Tanacetum coccineum]
MYFQKNVDYVELLWEDFTYQIDNKDFKKQEKKYYPRFIKVIIHHLLIQEKTLSWRNKIGMHTSKDDYLINTLRFVSRKEASQIYGVVLPECLTSPEMKESKAYKTYLCYATDEEPVQKGKQVKRSAKKSSTTPAAGIVIRETLVKTKSTGKEKVDVSSGKGIDLLSKVALAKKAQLKKVRKKSLRDLVVLVRLLKNLQVLKRSHLLSQVKELVINQGFLMWQKMTQLRVILSLGGNDEDDNNDEQEASDEGSGKENEREEQESDSEQDEESDDDNQEEEEVDQMNLKMMRLKVMKIRE